MTHPHHAIIAGAGIGGLSAALALALAGLRVSVLERADGPTELGAGLQLSPNATRILSALGLLDQLETIALEPEALRIRRARDGAELTRMPLGAVARARWGVPHLVVHRADLQALLLAQATDHPNITVQFGVEVMGFADSQAGIEVAGRTATETLRFEADVLIAADGQRSLLRDKLMPYLAGRAQAGQGRRSTRTAWRALVEADKAPDFALWLETNLWLGPKTHLVHYPLRGGQVINVVAITQEPPGHRPASAEGVDLWATAGDAAELQAQFTDWSREARALLSAAADWKRWPLFDAISVDNWSRGRVTLLGDAAHPMLPFMAQGSAQAIEDAAALAHHLGKAPAHGIREALAAYQNERIARATAIQLASRQQGKIYHMSGLAAFARDQVLNRIKPLGMMQKLDWIYAYNRA